MMPFPVGGYELNKEDHILALQEDETKIREALRSHFDIDTAQLAWDVSLEVLQLNED